MYKIKLNLHFSLLKTFFHLNESTSFLHDFVLMYLYVIIYKQQDIYALCETIESFYPNHALRLVHRIGLKI